MGVFLIVNSNKSSVNDIFEPEKLERYKDALHIEFDDYRIVKSRNGTFGFIHYAREDVFYSPIDQTYIHKEKDKLFITLLQGYLWKKENDQDILKANQLHELLNNTNCEGVRDLCNGEYSAVHYDEIQNKLVVFNDRLSLEKVYYYNNNGTTLISNRIRLIKEALQTSSPDLASLNWLSAIGIIVGNGTSENNISSIPQGAYLTIQKDKLMLHENHVFMIDSEFSQKFTKTSNQMFPLSLFKKRKVIDRFIDKAIDECAKNIEICLTKAPTAPFPLSGGKDSRAVLALIRHYDKNRKLNIFSNGFDKSSDVSVARAISSHYGINITVNTPKPPAERKDDWLVNKMMGHVYQTDGMLGAWDAKGYTVPAGGLALTGHVGELYRSSYNKNGKLDLSSVKSISRMFNINRGGLLLPETIHYYEKELQERMSFYLDNGAQPEDVPDLFYAMERIPNTIAELRRTDGYSKRFVNPLNTESLIKLAFHLGGKQRAADRIHFEIINRIDPWLASHPFADDLWDPMLKQYANGTKLTSETVKNPAELPKFGNWQHDIKKSFNSRSRLLDIVTSFPKSPMWDYCDRKKTEDKLKNNQFKSYVELISLYGFINTFFYTHKIESVMKIKNIE